MQPEVRPTEGIVPKLMDAQKFGRSQRDGGLKRGEIVVVGAGNTGRSILGEFVDPALYEQPIVIRDYASSNEHMTIDSKQVIGYRSPLIPRTGGKKKSKAERKAIKARRKQK